MKATDFWKSNYPDIVGVQVDEDGSIIEKVDLGVLLEAYHQHRIEQLGNICKEISKQEDCPADFKQIVDKEFWNLIDLTDNT